MVDANTKHPVIGFIGFGEAASAFVSDWRDQGYDSQIFVYDVKLDVPEQREELMTACKQLNVEPLQTVSAITQRATHLISSVTADQAMIAAESVGPLADHQRYLDINSVAPDKKKAAAKLLGAGYLDVAVLSPVHPKRASAPILVGGESASSEVNFLAQFFPQATVFSNTVGDASLIKMLRSIFVKGIEAVTTECALAASKAGFADYVFPTLNLTLEHASAADLARYNLERVATHGVRRAAEMDEVCATLDDLGMECTMTKAAAILQRRIGELQLAVPGSDELESDELKSMSTAVLKRLQSTQNDKLTKG